MHAVMASKKHQKSGTVQEEGLTNEGTHHLLLLHKQAHHIVGSLPAYINRVGLTACELSTSQCLKRRPPPSLRSNLSSLPMGRNGEFAEACRCSGRCAGTPRDVTYTVHLNGKGLVLIYVVSHSNQFSGRFGFENISLCSGCSWFFYTALAFY